MKTPRDLDGSALVSIFESLGYVVTRQRGSHIRMSRDFSGVEHHITIPNHSPIKIGTLNSILREVADRFKITKDELLTKFF